MGKHKMIAKSCPKCELQVAVASKSCKCGHTFFASRRGADCLPAVEDIKRRTGRVRRSQPQFYDAQHYQKQIKRRSPKKGSMDEDFKPKDKNESGPDLTTKPKHSSTRALLFGGRLKVRRWYFHPRARSLKLYHHQSTFRAQTLERNARMGRGGASSAPDGAPRARRRRALRRSQRPPPGNSSGERTRDPTPQLRPPQLARCRLILQEINRKISSVKWQPPADM